MEEAMKNVYRGVFNYSRSVETMYRRAATPRQAWFVMTEALAKKHEVTGGLVRGRFPWEDGGRGLNYQIDLEMEMSEHD